MTTVTVVVPLRIRQWGGRTAIIAPDGAHLSPDQAYNGAIPTRGDPALVKALARAHRWRRMLDAGEHGTARELTKAERVNEACISRALRLTLLAPGMVEAILDGRQPEGMTLPGQMKPFATERTEQHKSPGSAGHGIQATDAAARP